MQYSYISLYVVYTITSTSLKQLVDILVEWDKIPLKIIQILCDSIPRRIETVGITVTQRLINM
jgi:hypothetical protein